MHAHSEVLFTTVAAVVPTVHQGVAAGLEPSLVHHCLVALAAYHH
jgi:hypothetical protein